MLSQVSKIILIGTLILSANRLWADSSGESGFATDDQAHETSALESWQEDEREERWTWFGMGYESRRESAGNHGNTSPGGGNKGSGGTGPRHGNGRGR